MNNPPRFTKGANQTVAEDSGARTVAGWATAIDDGDPEVVQALKFTATSDNKPLFSVQPAIAANGTLTYTPAANANGLATVSVTLTDDASAGGPAITTTAQRFTITVRPVNDAPSFVKGPNEAMLENSGPRTVAGWATGISAGPADENGQSLTFITTNDNNALFSAQPELETDGRLTFTPAADMTGRATVTVTLEDDGGTADGGVDRSAAQTFTITVSEPAHEVIARRISYILWMDTSGFLGVWYLDGPQMIARDYLTPSWVPTNWRVAGTGDFNGDGNPDILWEETSGFLGVWYLDGPQMIGSDYLTPSWVPTNWRIAGAGDFNGDGRPDILWRETSGFLGVSYTNGPQMIASDYLEPSWVPTNWRIAGVSDFNGDGKPDILWQEISGFLAVCYMDGPQMIGSDYLTPSLVPTNWRIAGTGDFNGDGKPDILWQDTSGMLAVWYMSGSQMAGSEYLNPSQVPTNWVIVGSGDAKSDRGR